MLFLMSTLAFAAAVLLFAIVSRIYAAENRPRWTKSEVIASFVSLAFTTALVFPLIAMLATASQMPMALWLDVVAALAIAAAIIAIVALAFKTRGHPHRPDPA